MLDGVQELGAGHLRPHRFLPCRAARLELACVATALPRQSEPVMAGLLAVIGDKHHPAVLRAAHHPAPAAAILSGHPVPDLDPAPVDTEVLRAFGLGELAGSVTLHVLLELGVLYLVLLSGPHTTGFRTGLPFGFPAGTFLLPLPTLPFPFSFPLAATRLGFGLLPGFLGVRRLLLRGGLLLRRRFLLLRGCLPESAVAHPLRYALADLAGRSPRILLLLRRSGDRRGGCHQLVRTPRNVPVAVLDNDPSGRGSTDDLSDVAFGVQNR